MEEQLEKQKSSKLNLVKGQYLFIHKNIAMSYVLKTIYNSEVVIDDNCGVGKFYKVANLLKSDLKVAFQETKEGKEHLAWTFQYKSQRISLHFDVYGGISIRSDTNAAKNCLVTKEVGDFIESKVF